MIFVVIQLLALCVWAFIGWGIIRYLLASKVRKQKSKILHVNIGIFLLTLWLGWPFWAISGKRMYYDAQVNKMCSKDGGVKVYETVSLPSDKFDKWGLINFYRPTQGEEALGSNYIYKRNEYYYRRGSPELIMRRYKVIRQSDKELLGETILYERGGGGIPGPWQPSSYSCPDVRQAGPNVLLKSIFISSKGD